MVCLATTGIRVFVRWPRLAHFFRSKVRKIIDLEVFMTPNYTARKSLISTLSFWRIVSCILIVPILFLIARLVQAACYKIEFYDDKVITYQGVLNKSKKVTVFMGVAATSVEQTLFGRIFNYGSVKIDVVGKWDVDTHNIKNPAALEEYLQTKIMPVQQTTQFMQV